MTLYDIITKFKEIALKQPNVNYANDGDIYVLNSLPNIDYGVFFVTQTNHQQSENTMTYNLVLYYVDRLTGDENNKLEVQSTGIMTLGNIINIFNIKYPDVEINYDIQYHTFTQQFADHCAGVWADVTITADNNFGVCGYEYE